MTNTIVSIIERTYHNKLVEKKESLELKVFETLWWLISQSVVYEEMFNNVINVLFIQKYVDCTFTIVNLKIDVDRNTIAMTYVMSKYSKLKGNLNVLVF